MCGKIGIWGEEVTSFSEGGRGRELMLSTASCLATYYSRSSTSESVDSSLIPTYHHVQHGSSGVGKFRVSLSSPLAAVPGASC